MTGETGLLSCTGECYTQYHQHYKHISQTLHHHPILSSLSRPKLQARDTYRSTAPYATLTQPRHELAPVCAPSTVRISQFVAKHSFRIPGREAIQALVEELGNTNFKNAKSMIFKIIEKHNDETNDLATISALAQRGHSTVLPAWARYIVMDCMFHSLDVFGGVTKANYNSATMKVAMTNIAVKINQPPELLAMFVRDERTRFARKVSHKSRTKSHRRVFRVSATPDPKYDDTAHIDSLFSNVDEGECDPARASRPIKVQQNESVGVSSDPLEKKNPTRADVISDISNISTAGVLHKDAGLAITTIIQAFIAARQLGQQAKPPTRNSDGSPKLKGRVKEIWETYLAAQEGREWTRSKFSSPWGDINSGLILLLHYPSLGSSQSMYNFQISV
jgi:hypothetical protein